MFECINSKEIPYGIIMNCKNINTPREWYPNHRKNLDIIRANEAILQKQKWGYLPEQIDDCSIYPCNLLWYWFATNRDNLSSFANINKEDLADKIEFSLSRKREIFSPENILRLSNFLRIKSFFEERLARIT